MGGERNCEKKLVEIVLRDPAGLVPKGVPPDKSVGAWPSVQEKTTGIGNVGKSPYGGTNDEHQSLKVQEDRSALKLFMYNQVHLTLLSNIVASTYGSRNRIDGQWRSCPQSQFLLLKEHQEAFLKANENVWYSTGEFIVTMKILMEYFE